MSSLSIIDKAQNHTQHLRHFVVQTRNFQIEKARDVNMYENLRVYIKRQNEKRKQEMEMSEELKRARREKELKHKRDKLTLGEIKEEISKNESKLHDLQNEKHRLFTEFKKVLNEDENRKNIQRAKEAATFNNMTNITFGPVTTNANTPTISASTNSNQQQKQYQQHIASSQSGHIMSSNHHNNSNILPVSLHHLQPIQPMFFSQPHNTTASSATQNMHSSNPSSSSAMNHHRLNGRVPTPTTYAGSSHSKLNQPPHQGSIYSKSMQPHHSGPLSLTSMSSAVSTAPSMMPSSMSSSYAADRHRLSYKRSHDQALSSPVNMQASVGGVITGVSGPVTSAPPSHMHYHMSGYKPSSMGQPSMHQLPPGYPQLGGQHGIPNLEQLQNLQNLNNLNSLPIYQSLLHQAYGIPSNANPMSFLNNGQPK